MNLLSEWRKKRFLARFASDKEFAKQFLSLIIKQNPVGALIAAESNAGIQPRDFDSDSHLKVYFVNVYCYAAIRAISRDVAATPLLIQNRRRVEGKWQWITEDETNSTAASIMDLFSYPNPDESWNQLSERWVESKLASGDGYLAFDETDNEFWYLNPTWVRVKTDALGRTTGFEVASKIGKSLDLDVTNVIHLKSSNPAGTFYGMPPSETIKQTIIGKLNLDKFLNAVWKNSAMVGLAVSMSPMLDVTNQEHRDIMRKEVQQLYGGVDKAGKTFIGGHDTKIERLSYPIKELLPTEINDMILREICAAYGVPPIKINILDEATYNNAKEQERIYQEGTVEPERCIIEQTLNIQHVWPRFDDNWRVYYDRSKVLALQENRDEKSIYISNEYKSGIIKLNEAREALGYEKVDESEGGEDFYDPFSFEALGGAPPAEGDLSKNRPSGVHKGMDTPRLQKWKALDRRLRKRERKVQSAASKFFREQLDRLLVKIEKVTGNGKMMSRLLFSLKADEIPENWINDLFNIDEENAYILKALGDVLEEIAKEAGQTALENAGVDLQFNVQDPRVQIILENMKNKIKGINNTTWEQVRDLISDSYQNGDSIAEMSSKLSDAFGEFSKIRSGVIARTETNKFSNASSMEGLRQAGIEKKEWLSARDDRVRPEHADADGQIRGLDEPFDVGGEELSFPGSGSIPENNIQCRCQIVMAE